MRRSLGTFALVATLFAATAAGAESWYAGIFGGLNYAHDGNVNDAGVDASYDVGLGIGGNVGFYVQDNIRLEGELSYRSNDLDSVGGIGVNGDAETLALMANVFFDFKLESAVEPYLGAGIGLADVDYRVSGITYNDTALALQLVGGIGIEMAPATQLTVDYRMFLTEELKIASGLGFGSVEYVNSAIMIGVRRRF